MTALVCLLRPGGLPLFGNKHSSLRVFSCESLRVGSPQFLPFLPVGWGDSSDVCPCHPRCVVMKLQGPGAHGPLPVPSLASSCCRCCPPKRACPRPRTEQGSRGTPALCGTACAAGSGRAFGTGSPGAQRGVSQLSGRRRFVRCLCCCPSGNEAFPAGLSRCVPGGSGCCAARAARVTHPGATATGPAELRARRCQATAPPPRPALP